MGGAPGTPKPRQMVTCMFCGLTRLTSIEDVIPKWARYALDPTSSVTVRAEPGDATARMQHLVVTLHGMVCEACNNGWMHDLEEKVKPFLKPMLVNKHDADLGLMQQRDLARWAVMKVLLMEHVMRQKHPQFRAAAGYVPSKPELAWLMADACPPPRSRVWLGAFDPQGTYAVQTQARLLQSAPQPGGGGPVDSHVTTLTIGSVLLQACSAAATETTPATRGRSSPKSAGKAGYPMLWRQAALAVELCQRAAEITGQVLPGSYRPGSRTGADIRR
jgi:hypothetical protein